MNLVFWSCRVTYACQASRALALKEVTGRDIAGSEEDTRKGPVKFEHLPLRDCPDLQTLPKGYAISHTI